MHREWYHAGTGGGESWYFRPYVNRIIKKQDGVVNKTFVQMLEALGYDIELTYVKRDGNCGEVICD